MAARSRYAAGVGSAGGCRGCAWASRCSRVMPRGGRCRSVADCAARASCRAAHDVVAPDPRLPLELPAEERAVEPQLAKVERRAAENLAGGAPGPVGVRGPQLEPRAAGVALRV